MVSVLAIMTLRQDPAGASDDTLVALDQSLVAVHDPTFLLGPGFVVGVGNGHARPESIRGRPAAP